MLMGELSTPVNLEGEIYRGVGTTDYNALENKPTYNGHIIEGDLTSESLGIWQPKNFSTEEQNTGIKDENGNDIYFKIFNWAGSITGNTSIYVNDVLENNETFYYITAIMNSEFYGALGWISRPNEMYRFRGSGKNIEIYTQNIPNWFTITSIKFFVFYTKGAVVE